MYLCGSQLSPFNSSLTFYRLFLVSLPEVISVLIIDASLVETAAVRQSWQITPLYAVPLKQSRPRTAANAFWNSCCI